MPGPLQIDESASDSFYDRALPRIRRFMAVIGVAATAVTLIMAGWRIALGVFLGCLAAWANLFWLNQAVNVLADHVTVTGRPRSGAGTVAKFLLRYALIGVGAYVIFLSSRESLYGFLGGLFLTVAAILCEAAYEAYVALRRGL